MRTPIAPLVLLLSLLPLACDRDPEPAAPAAPAASATGAAHDPAPAEGPWDVCLRPSELEGVARETAPNLDLEVEGVRVVTGALGQRGPDVDASGDVLRIAAVGGELTFGTALPAEQAWPQALASQLDRSMLSGGRRVAALNLGTVSASPADVLGLATQRALAWQPWLMVVELDASRAGAAPLELATRLKALRAAAAAAQCGVLVVVSLPPGEPLDESDASVAALRVLIDEAQRAGFSTLDLREVFAGQASESLALGATPQQRGHATAHAQGLVFEAVKRRLFDSGLLTAAFESR